MSTKTIGIVIVPGGMHVPAHYTLLEQDLTQSGYRVMTTDIPSNGGPVPLIGISQDIKAIQKNVKTFVDQDMDVVLVMHSLGGVLGSEACKGFKPEDQANGKGIVGLVYMSAFAPDEGVSIFAATGNALAPWTTVLGEPGPDKAVFMRAGAPSYDVRDIFYNDCEPEVAEDAISRLVLLSASSCFHECTYPAWKEIESHYLICQLDQAIPVEGQVMLASQEGGRWKHVESIQAGHAPFLSKTKETALFIRKCIGENV